MRTTYIISFIAVMMFTFGNAAIQAQEIPQQPPKPAPETTTPVDCAKLPIRIDAYNEWFIADSSSFFTFRAKDWPPECDSVLKFDIKGLPGTYELMVYGGGGAEVQWYSSGDHAGQHTVTLSIMRGKEVVTRNISVRVSQSWESVFLPGLRYTASFPKNSKRFGIFHGGGVEYVLVAWAAQNEQRGPSHGRVHLNVDLLQSTEDEIGQLMLYSMGLELSFERNPMRNFMIPFFGLEFGGVFQEQVRHLFQFSPGAGVLVWSQHNGAIVLKGAYLIPTSALEDFQGWRAEVGLNFTLW